MKNVEQERVGTQAAEQRAPKEGSGI